MGGVWGCPHAWAAIAVFGYPDRLLEYRTIYLSVALFIALFIALSAVSELKGPGQESSQIYVWNLVYFAFALQKYQNSDMAHPTPYLLKTTLAHSFRQFHVRSLYTSRSNVPADEAIPLRF